MGTEIYNANIMHVLIDHLHLQYWWFGWEPGQLLYKSGWLLLTPVFMGRAFCSFAPFSPSPMCLEGNLQYCMLSVGLQGHPTHYWLLLSREAIYTPQFLTSVPNIISGSGVVSQDQYYWHFEWVTLFYAGLSCAIRNLPTLPVSVNYMPVASPSCDNQKCSQTLPNVSYGRTVAPSWKWQVILAHIRFLY